MREYAGEKEILDVSEKMRNAYNSERLEELAIELKIRRGMFPSLSSGTGVTC